MNNVLVNMDVPVPPNANDPVAIFLRAIRDILVSKVIGYDWRYDFNLWAEITRLNICVSKGLYFASTPAKTWRT